MKSIEDLKRMELVEFLYNINLSLETEIKITKYSISFSCDYEEGMNERNVYYCPFPYKYIKLRFDIHRYMTLETIDKDNNKKVRSITSIHNESKYHSSNIRYDFLHYFIRMIFQFGDVKTFFENYGNILYGFLISTPLQLEGEEWKFIENKKYDLYQISNYGRIKALDYNRIIPTKDNKVVLYKSLYSSSKGIKSNNIILPYKKGYELILDRLVKKHFK